MVVDNEVNMDGEIEEQDSRPSVSTDSCAFPFERIVKELKEISLLVQQFPGIVADEMREHKVSARYKDRHMEVVRREMEKVHNKLELLANSCRRTRVLHGKICELLDLRGIESEDEWEEYISTMGKDGDILATICSVLNTNTLHAVNVVKELRSKAVKEDVVRFGNGCEGRSEFANINSGRPVDSDRDHGLLQAPATQWTGARYEPRWKHCVESFSAETRETQGQGLTMDMLSYFQSLSCVDPGVYKGKANENFSEFIRRFRRKYQRVVMSDHTLIEILGDDHLGGRAKSMFLSLLLEIRSRGFEAVVAELGNLLAEDTVAGRMRAISELRELRIRPQQDVADFCVALEKLGRKANPRGSIEDSSLEFAHILLSNLRDWPEHVQLLSALHRTKPEKAYEEVKQLALSIEQSKRMFGESQGKRDWYSDKSRARSYKGYNGLERVSATIRKETVARREEDDREAVKGVYGEAGSARRAPEQKTLPKVRAADRNTNDNRNCFNCSRFGHVAKECPQRTHVKWISECQGREETPPEDGISLIIQKARSMGVRMSVGPVKTTPLVGKRISRSAGLLQTQIPALLDTGSMISIIPVGVLARAKDRGFNVGSLEVINGDGVHVYDASNNKMEFLGAVKIGVELKGGRSSLVAFYIADSRDD